MSEQTPTTTEEVRQEIIRLATAGLPADAPERIQAAIDAVTWFDAWLATMNTPDVDQRTTNVTRVEVIDGPERAYVKYGTSIELLSFQDDDRTLKVFLRSR